MKTYAPVFHIDGTRSVSMVSDLTPSLLRTLVQERDGVELQSDDDDFAERDDDHPATDR
ncbi:MAG: hypothetical protein QOF63_2696 [Thermoanaerobaculia bacterium]|jgi:hypothetical protein|nr:hypothetical protein [Thermoanaerobaculia bacterium]MEA2417384.1 hypothetical protein [Thermoanaerobaculia bacterium]